MTYVEEEALFREHLYQHQAILFITLIVIIRVEKQIGIHPFHIPSIHHLIKDPCKKSVHIIVQIS
jgi:hypothetical protein